MDKKKSLNWLKAAGIRALKTLSQTAIATMGTSALITDVNWSVVASSAILAAILSLLMAIQGLPELSIVTTENISKVTVEDESITAIEGIGQ